MRRKSGREKAVNRLWREHMRADFPARLRGEELAGVDLVMLDADIAGCVTTWRANHCSLDEDSRQVLLGCIANLDKVLPLLRHPQEIQYYMLLRELAVTTSGDGQ